MAELTMERLVDVEAVDDSAAAVASETVVPVETLTSAEVKVEPTAAWSQRAIGCGAILCAGCPLVMICPSVRTAEVETLESTVSNDIFDELATNFDSDSSGQASRRASDGAPAPVETRAADCPSLSESKLAEVDAKVYDEEAVIEKPSVKKGKPVNPIGQESAPAVVEQQPVRTYLEELLDDSVDVVVAQSLRQPVIKDEIVAVEQMVSEVVEADEIADADKTEIVETGAPEQETARQVDLSEPLETEPVVAEVFVAPVDSEEVSEPVDLVSLMPDEPEVDLEIVDVIEAPSTDSEMVEAVVPGEDFMVTNEPTEEATVEAAELVDVAPLLDVDLPLLGDMPYAAVGVDLPQLHTEPTIDELEPESAVLQETLLEIDTILAKIAADHETIVNEIKKELIDEFHFDWRTYADDIDEEHWPLDEDADSAMLGQKIKKVITKLLGRRAVYALSSSGISD